MTRISNLADCRSRIPGIRSNDQSPVSFFYRSFQFVSDDVPDESPDVVTVTNDAHQAVRKGVHNVLDLKLPINIVENFRVQNIVLEQTFKIL